MKNRNPQLPKILKDQINSDKGRKVPPESSRKGKPGGAKSRKDIRKQSRVESKQRKATFFSKPHYDASNGNSAKRNAESVLSSQPPLKRARFSGGVLKVNVPATISTPKLLQSDVKPPNKFEPYAKESIRKKPVSKTMSFDPSTLLAISSEDAEEKRLEKLLGMGKKAKKSARDDFDTLLDDLGGNGSSDSDADDSQFDDGDHLELLSDSEERTGSEEDESNESDGESYADDDEWGGIGDTDQKPLNSSVGDGAAVAGVAGKDEAYITPHLRLKPNTTDSEEIVKLRKQLKGLLNRLTEQNIAAIVVELEDLYRKHRRNDITTITSDLILEGVCLHAMLSDAFVSLHAALIASLYKIIGVDFAAHFVRQLVLTYDRHFVELKNADLQQDEGGYGKECSNLLILLSGLYSFQVIACVLVYDIIKELLGGELGEFEVELLLKLVRNSGPRLHNDDPLALNDIIDLAHENIKLRGVDMTSRTKFMVEALADLKSNKSRRNGTSAGTIGTTDRLKKFLAGLSKKNQIKAHEPLRVSVADLRSADSKGKWWLVGSAWSGDPLLDHQNAQEDSQPKSVPKENASSATDQLLKLAKLQGMNTDVRRSVFVVVMNSEDYVDACERLSHLHLAEIQQREVIRVLFHCSGNEKVYNPYYTLVLQRLLSTSQSHSHKVTVQYCIWDFLREMGERNVGGAEIVKSFSETLPTSNTVSTTKTTNLARLLGWLIAKNVTSLTVLKPLEFMSLQPTTTSFLQQMVNQILTSIHSVSPIASSIKKGDLPESKNGSQELLADIFGKATKVPSLCQGLAYVLPRIFQGEVEKERENEGGEGYLAWCLDVIVDVLKSGVMLEGAAEFD